MKLHVFVLKRVGVDGQVLLGKRRLGEPANLVEDQVKAVNLGPVQQIVQVLDAR